MTYIYYANCMNIDCTLINELDLENKKRVLGYPEGIKRNLSLGAKLLLKKYLEEEINYYPNGKPYCKNKYISIAHSHELAMVAISDYPVGVDIEKIDDERRIFKKLKGNTLEEKYLEWTKCEAYYKRISKGSLFIPVYDGYIYSNKILNYAYSVSLEESDEIVIEEVSL